MIKNSESPAPETSRQYCARKGIRCSQGCDTFDCYPETDRTPPLCKNCWERYWLQFQLFGAYSPETSMAGVTTPHTLMRQTRKIALTLHEHRELRRVQRELGTDDLTSLIIAGKVARVKLRDQRRRELTRSAGELRAELGLPPLE